jgi:hypothetical protein
LPFGRYVRPDTSDQTVVGSAIGSAGLARTVSDARPGLSPFPWPRIVIGLLSLVLVDALQ